MKRYKTIRFLVNPIGTYGEPGWAPDQTFLAGTEESVMQWARQFHKKGYKTEVYYDGLERNFEGVDYLPREKYHGGDGVTINVKSSDIEPQEPTWYLTNETNARLLDLSKFDGVILPSKWAFDNLEIEHPNIGILAHGYDSELVYRDKKIRNQCLYSSSPDRGVSNLIYYWPQVVEQVPDATLIVTYDGKLDTPNTMCLGKVDAATMAELYRTSEFWLHPCNGGELFCMAAINAQAAGALPVYFPTMALSETVRHGVATNPKNFVKDLVTLMGDRKWQQDMRYKLGEEYFMNWSDTANVLENIISR